MKKYYLLKNNRLFKGPYTIEDLQGKILRSTDKVWFEGLPDWVPVMELEQLKASVMEDSEVKPGLLNKVRNLFKM